MIRLYDKDSIDSLINIYDDDLLAIKDYFYPFIKWGVKDYISNVNATVCLLEVDNYYLPVTVHEDNFDDSYVSSLYSHYISCAKEELYLLENPKLEKYLSGLLDAVGKRLKQNSCNQIVYVNNWLFSTNLQVELSSEQIQEIKDYLIGCYPNHMIVFRSLNDCLHEDLIKRFKKNGFKSLASRQVYIEPKDNELSTIQKKHIRKDSKLLNDKGYELIEDMKPTDKNISRIKELYDQLYIEKYSSFNPMFTEKFYEHSMQNPIFNYIGVQDNGKLVGCVGYWHLNNVITSPILGYELDLGKKSGLYRIMTHQLRLACEKHNYTNHQSSGVSSFKLNRGATASIEYSMIYYDHLSFYRTLDMKMLRFLINKIGIKMLKDAGKKI